MSKQLTQLFFVSGNIAQNSTMCLWTRTQNRQQSYVQSYDDICVEILLYKYLHTHWKYPQLVALLYVDVFIDSWTNKCTHMPCWLAFILITYLNMPSSMGFVTCQNLYFGKYVRFTVYLFLCRDGRLSISHERFGLMSPTGPSSRSTETYYFQNRQTNIVV